MEETGEVLPLKKETGGAIISTAQQTLTHRDSACTYHLQPCASFTT